METLNSRDDFQSFMEMELLERDTRVRIKCALTATILLNMGVRGIRVVRWNKGVGQIHNCME